MLTQEAFLAFYPQFRHFSPAPVLTEALRRANARFEDFAGDAEEARRLFTAHHLTLYAMTAPPSSVPPSSSDPLPPEVIASAGRAETSGKIASKRVGEVQVSYASSSALRADGTALSALTQTLYGEQLLTLLRLHGGSRYIP